MFIISEDNKYYVWWQPIIGLASILSSYVAMYSSAFAIHDQTDLEHDILITYEATIDILFTVDILIPFLMEYKTDDGRVIRDLTKIAKRYL